MPELGLGLGLAFFVELLLALRPSAGWLAMPELVRCGGVVWVSMTQCPNLRALGPQTPKGFGV